MDIIRMDVMKVLVDWGASVARHSGFIHLYFWNNESEVFYLTLKGVVVNDEHPYKTDVGAFMHAGTVEGRLVYHLNNGKLCL